VDKAVDRALDDGSIPIESGCYVVMVFYRRKDEYISAALNIISYANTNAF